MSDAPPDEQRGWAAFVHACVVLDIPFFLVTIEQWGFKAGYSITLVALAPIVSYMIYRRTRRHPEREWLRFQALQATLLQFAVMVLVFVLPPSLWFAYNIVAVIVAAAIMYGLAGAATTYTGRDFRYLLVGRLAEAIVRRSQRRS